MTMSMRFSLATVLMRKPKNRTGNWLSVNDSVCVICWAVSCGKVEGNTTLPLNEIFKQQYGLAHWKEIFVAEKKERKGKKTITFNLCEWTIFTKVLSHQLTRYVSSLLMSHYVWSRLQYNCSQVVSDGLLLSQLLTNWQLSAGVGSASKLIRYFECF